MAPTTIISAMAYKEVTLLVYTRKWMQWNSIATNSILSIDQKLRWEFYARVVELYKASKLGGIGISLEWVKQDKLI